MPLFEQAITTIQEGDADVLVGTRVLDFNEPDATLTSTASDEVDVNMSLYDLLAGTRAWTGNHDAGTFILSNIGAAGTDFTAGGGLTLASTLTLTPMTAGSVLYAGTAGAVSQDNATFFWNSTDKHLVVGSQVSSHTIAGVARKASLSVHDDGVAHLGLGLVKHTNGTQGSRLAFLMSRGTEGTPLIVQDDDILLSIEGLGYDGGDYEFAGKIELQVEGTPGSADMGGRWVFYTSADNGATPAERLSIANSGLVTVGSGGSFALVSGANDLGVVGDVEVDGQTRFDGTIGWQSAPGVSSMWNAVYTSASVVNGFNVDITATAGSGTTAATVLDFTLSDIATHAGALLTVTGANFTIRYNRDVANQPASYNLRAINIANYGLQSGVTVNAGTWNYRGIKVNRNNAGANVSGGTHTFIDFESDSDATGYPGGTRQYAAKFSSDVWIIDSEPFFFGTGEDCSITYNGTSWIFDVLLATTEIVFNESSVDCDFRVESNGNANGIFLDAGNDRLGVMTATTFATLTVGGGIGGNVRTVTGTSNQLSGADWLVICDSSGGNVTVNLPPAANKGQMITIKRSSASNVVTITCDAGDNIQGDADDSVTLTAAVYQGRTYIADGANTWYRIDAQANP